MRLRLFVSGAVLALALSFVAGQPSPAAAAEIEVTTAGELISAFDSATGTDNTVVLSATIEVDPADGSIEVAPDATITLDLNGHDLTIVGAPDSAGIGVTTGTTLRIIDSLAAVTPGHLTVSGGEYGSGIGSGRNSGSVAADGTGRIILDGASVFARGGASGAAVGGGLRHNGGTIDISGGMLTAEAVTCGAGIGGGCDAGAGTITITGGEVVASGADGAGIGGGGNGRSGAISINAGVVVATGDGVGAGIGGGGASSGSNAGEILISGGTVVATGGDNGGSGIGSAFGRSHGPVTITGGTVHAQGGDQGSLGPGPGIGHSNTSHPNSGPLIDPMQIMLSGGTVTATAGAVSDSGLEWAAAIGGSAGSPGSAVTITGTASVTVEAVGSESVIGHGSGRTGTFFGSLTIGAAGHLIVASDSVLSIPASVSVTNSGTLELLGSLLVGGSFTNSGSLRSESDIVSDGAFTNTAEFHNDGLFIATGPVLNAETGVIDNTGSVLTFGSFTNDGFIESCCALNLFGVSANTGTLVNNDILATGGSFLNTGLMVNNELLVNDAVFTNSGALHNAGEIELMATLTNTGTIIDSGIIDDVSLITVHNFENVFDLNGGTGSTPPSQRILAASFDDAGQAIPADPVRDGHIFLGWNSAPDGTGSTLNSSQALGNVSSTLTWYAHWGQPGPGPAPDPDPDSGGAYHSLAPGGSDTMASLLPLILAVMLIVAGTTALVAIRERHRHGRV